MKNKLIILISIALFVSGTALAQIEFAPYYNYQFAEGISVSPEGDMGFLINLSNDIGMIIKPFPGHSFIGFYSLKYQGPGLKRQEGREFSERYLDHLFVGRHHCKIKGIVVKSQFDVLIEGRRAGTNETWESGLYNFNRYGGNTSLSKKLWEIDWTGSFGYHFMTFPNYTDMLAELRSGADPSASEGKQNNHIISLGAKGIYKNNTAALNITEQLYTKQKVAVDKAQSDGSYYSSDKQKDMTVNLAASRKQALSRKSVINPGLTFIYKNSNQNYQHFAEITSTAPVSFHEDYNDYTDIIIGIPFTLSLSQKWSFLFSPEISYKSYLSRAKRDENGHFDNYDENTGEKLDNYKKQSRVLGIYTIGFRNQIGESSSSMLFFTLQKQTSNMKFERYLPYNYSGFSVGLKFQMEY